jgi:hypothetical protein
VKIILKKIGHSASLLPIQKGKRNDNVMHFENGVKVEK